MIILIFTKYLLEELILVSEIEINSGKKAIALKGIQFLHFGSDLVLRCNIANS